MAGTQEEPNRNRRQAISTGQNGVVTTIISLLSPGLPDSQTILELRTRLHIPGLRSHLVTRTHLLKRLEQITTSTLTLISAPAGSGKTTVIVQWLSESKIPVAWFSLEPQDNEPVRFLSYLIAALQTLDPHLGASARSLLLSPHFTSSVSMEIILTMLTNDLLQRVTGDSILVLDDYHVLTAPSIQQAMTFLVEHCPPQLHLVLVTRADPPLPLARLRARGQLTELRASQLQFEDSETATFLSEVMALDLSPQDIAAVQKRTEGWIAGLLLAALSLQGHGNVEQFLAEFTGSHRHVADFLMEEVLSRQPEDVQSFLLHTSLLERLCGPLCDAIADRNDSDTLLVALERANLFLVPLDEQRQWYRYHQLFADMLRARLQRRIGAEGVANLYMKASTWYERNGFPVEAVEAALAAGNADQAADLLEQISSTMILRLQHTTLRRWVEALPENVWETRPALCCSYAIALFITGTADTYKAPLRMAERLFRDRGNNSGLGMVYMLRALAASLREDAMEGIRYGKEALILLPQEAQVARNASMCALAEGYRRTGNVKAAWQALSEARSIDEQIQNLFGIAGTAILRSRLLVMQGKLRQAAESYHAVLESVSEQHEFALEARISLAELLREANEFDPALAHLKQVHTLAHEVGNDVLLARAALIEARVVQAQGNVAQTEAAFATAVNQARRCHHQSLTVEAQAYQVRWWLTQKKMDAVSRWHAEIAATLPLPADYQQEPIALTLARVLIAQDEAASALDLLGRFRVLARTQGRTGSEIEILALTALAYHVQGKSDQALQILHQALLLAGPEGYIRLFVDEGSPMAALLRLLLASWKSKRGGDYIRRLLNLLENTSPESSRTTHQSIPPALLEPLSPRERKVLRLLAAGLSNPEIAGELVVSLNTVKTQVQSLYRKLQVSNRQQAIAAAKELQLL